MRPCDTPKADWRWFWCDFFQPYLMTKWPFVYFPFNDFFSKNHLAHRLALVLPRLLWLTLNERRSPSLLDFYHKFVTSWSADIIFWKFVTQIRVGMTSTRLYPTKCGKFSAELKPAKRINVLFHLAIWTNIICSLAKIFDYFYKFIET